MSKYKLKMTKTQVDNFISKIKFDNKTGCWNWLGYKISHGYGRMGLNRKLWLTHRVSFMHFKNEALSAKDLVLHKCNNPSCCNPDHLYKGDQEDNMQDLLKSGYKHEGQIGSKNYNAKLTKNDIPKIRKRYHNGESIASIARDYGVNPKTLKQAAVGITWKHVGSTAVKVTRKAPRVSKKNNIQKYLRNSGYRKPRKTVTLNSRTKPLTEEQVNDFVNNIKVDGRTGCWKWIGTKHQGYGSFSINGEQHKSHRVSLWLYKGVNFKKGEQANHLCPNRSCVNPDHLYVGTHLENIEDAKRDGVIPHGSKHFKAKLNEKAVRRIKKRLAKGEMMAFIAREYGVAFSTIKYIRDGKTWKHVK